jgi:DNA-binding PucR family transcriptional regulator
LGEQGEGLTAAAGSSVAEPAGLARSRTEATEVAQLIAAGRVARPVAALEDVWAEASVSRAAEALRASGDGGPLEALAAHDDARGTAYLRTLAAWLDHPGEPARAAAELHIHANTLRSRMQRLGEVVRLDLDSPAVRLALRLQLASLGFFPSTNSL